MTDAADAAIEDLLAELAQAAAEIRELLRDRDEAHAEAGMYALALNATEARLSELKAALQEIAEQDPIELALDPQWSQRQARFALEVTRGD